MGRNTFLAFAAVILGLSFSPGLSNAATATVATPTNVPGPAYMQSFTSTPPLASLCSVGKPETFSKQDNSYWVWQCTGANDGKAPAFWAYAIQAPVGKNGACGAPFFKHLSASPTANLCAQGEATPVISSGPGWYWTCKALAASTAQAPTTDATCLAVKNGRVAPVVTLTAKDTTIGSGKTTIISFSTASADSCVASGDWSGTFSGLAAVSGQVTTIAATVAKTYTLTCAGFEASTTKSVTVAIAAVPTVTLAATPTTIASGATSALSWSSTNATSCVASGGWTGSQAVSGKATTAAATVAKTYTLACTGLGGTATQSVTVAVAPAPIVSLSSNVASLVTGNSANLTWSSTNATSCTAAGGWLGNLALKGTAATPVLKSTTGFNISCTGLGGTTSQAVTITVTPAPINGACGSSNGALFTAAPSTGLCSVGTASTVTGSGPWTWTCAGQYSGTTAQCAANVEGVSGTFEHPFGAQSPWNSRPINPVFGTYQLPKDIYFPAIAAGAYSTAGFQALATDGPMVIKSTVYDATTKTYSCSDAVSKLYDADAELMHPSMVIPHWPSNVVSATGGDGHADIYDETTGIIHSFWQLRNYNSEWCATEYTWSPLSGRGFGDPAHYMQGARAAGVPSNAGVMRIDEVNDGEPMYHHALAMSLPYSGMASNPTHVFPATTADSDAAATNYGQIPEGGLMMLPPSFDITTVKGSTAAQTATLQKVARTLQTYGAYIVDRNVGTPYALYVEIGADFVLMPPGKWDNNIANSLVVIQDGLRLVTKSDGFLDANGVAYTPNPNGLNLISMRNVWTPSGYKGAAPTETFNTWTQSAVFTNLTGPTTFYNAGYRALTNVGWGAPTAGLRYRFTPLIAEGATMTMSVVNSGGTVLTTTGAMVKGQVFDFTWPTGGARVAMRVLTSGTSATESASATLVNITQ